MKKKYFLFLTLSITINSFAQLINEIQPNPLGADLPNQSVELKGTPFNAFSGVLLSIDSDILSPGTVDRINTVSGTFDVNGLLVFNIPDLESPSFTLVLLSNFAGSTSTDIDTNNDGIVDNISTFGTVYDVIGSPDSAGDEPYLYGAQLGGSDFKAIGTFEHIILFRDGITNDLYAATLSLLTYNIDAIEVMSSDFDKEPTATTFGAVNPTYTGLSSEDILINSFSIYPNPTSLDFVNIISRTNDILKIVVFDVFGKQVINTTITNERLDVSRLNTGLYLMRVSQGDTTVTKKLVIK